MKTLLVILALVIFTLVPFTSAVAPEAARCKQSSFHHSKSIPVRVPPNNESPVVAHDLLCLEWMDELL
jgi:hypothetical protein